MEVSKLINSLIKQKKLMVFCGAGISINSGIPTVYPLLTKLLSELGCENEHIKLLFNSSFPFEAIMENIKERVDISKLIKLFDLNNPNSNHNLIAWLAKNEYLNTILTTNFDQNIEIALSNSGLNENEDYFVISDLDKFNIENYSDKIIVVKLHGNIKEPESVLTTISKIANRRNTNLMHGVLENIFLSNRFENILFIGYSFSDHFDIKPAIVSMPTCNKNVFFIQHQNTETTQRVVDSADNPLFDKFLSAQCLQCNFEAVVSLVYDEFQINKFSYKKSDEWIAIIESWTKSEFDKDSFVNKKNCLGYLFIAAGFINISKYYAELNLDKIDSSREGKILQMFVSDIIGKSYLKDPNERDAGEAAKHYITARQLAENLELNHFAKTFSGDLGSCYLMQQDFLKAEELFNEAIEYYKPLLDNSEQREKIIEKYIRISIHLAHSYAKRGMFPQSINLYKEILPLSEEGGFTSSFELCMTGYGLASVLNNDLKTGLQLFTSAYPIAKAYGSIDRIRSLFFLICSWTKEVEGLTNAKEFYDKEIKYIKETTDFDRPLEEIPERLIKDYKYKK